MMYSHVFNDGERWIVVYGKRFYYFETEKSARFFLGFVKWENKRRGNVG